MGIESIIVWLIVGGVYLICNRLYDSPWGRTLRAVRDNEDAARAVGKDKVLGVFMPELRGLNENVSMFYEPFIVDSMRAKQVLGLEATPLRQTIRDAIAWYRANSGHQTHNVATRQPIRPLLLASGTPITNTLGEMYTLQRFMQPDELHAKGKAQGTFDLSPASGAADDHAAAERLNHLAARIESLAQKLAD